MRQNHYLDDGAYSAVRCVVEMVRQAAEGKGRDLNSAILESLKEPLESQEYRLKAPPPAPPPPPIPLKLHRNTPPIASTPNEMVVVSSLVCWAVTGG